MGDAALLELMFVDSKRAQLRVKGRCRQAQPRGSALWPIDFATCLAQNRFDLSFAI
jgi:hypothetical protein